MILNDSPVIFKDSFDVKKDPSVQSRTGDLDPNVWGVSRASGWNNAGAQQFNIWPATELVGCNGTTTVLPPNDIKICNGQLREATNDNPSGQFAGGTVTVLAMYPKQPFDFTGRTGTVAFDISNDAQNSHAAWPEFWFTDTPVPTPFVHFDTWRSLPQHGFGIRFYGSDLHTTPRRWTVGAATVVRNWVMDDTEGYGTRTALALEELGTVLSPPDNSGLLNHVELRIAQNQIDVYATDAGVAPSVATLKHIASITNANLSATRGLIWLEDVHYNADKAAEGIPNPPPSQSKHTFVWDNVEFDGPFTYRDFSYDALDANVPVTNLPAGAPAVNALGKWSGIGADVASWNVLNIPANPNPAAVRVVFNFLHDFGPVTTLNVTVNGHAHSVPWPYPDTAVTWRTHSVTIPVADLITGTNIVQIGANAPLIVSNVNIVLVNVPGGVPVLPGSNNGYPNNNPPPPPPPPPPPLPGATCTVTVGAVPVQTVQQGHTSTFNIPITVNCQ